MRRERYKRGTRGEVPPGNGRRGEDDGKWEKENGGVVVGDWERGRGGGRWGEGEGWLGMGRWGEREGWWERGMGEGAGVSVIRDKLGEQKWRDVRRRKLV